MEVCAKWFSLAIKEDKEDQKSELYTDIVVQLNVGEGPTVTPSTTYKHTCTSHGVNFRQTLFVPNVSVYNKIGTSTLQPTDSQVDVSWQLTLQRTKINEYITRGEKGDSQSAELTSDEGKDDTERLIRRCEDSTVFPSLPLAIKWLRDTVLHNQSVRYQVLVTGSLHLVGDVLKLVKK